MPQIAFYLPSSDRIKPFQQNRENCALQGKEKTGSRHKNRNAPSLDLKAYKKYNIRNQITSENKQTIRYAKCFSLAGKEADRLLQGRVAGQQNANGGV